MFVHRYISISLVLLLFLSPFCHAQEKGDIEDQQAKQAIPPLYLASKQGKLKKVKELIAMGTDVNTANANGRTPLMVAVYYGNKSIVKELLSEGVDLDATDGQGRTALMTALANQKMNIVDLLLASGADVTVEDNRKQTALTLVEKSDLNKSRKKELVKILEAAAE